MKENTLLRMRRLKMSKNDFQILAILGKGSYGEVYLARKRDTGEVLALKKIPKSRFSMQNKIYKLKMERDIMVQHKSHWLIKLKYSFQTNMHLFLGMEFLPGGDIKNLLDHVGCFVEEHALFYFGEMLLAVDALHRLGYIHRDIKPDNFMVDAVGHLKLIDFGLSKEGGEHTHLEFSLKFQSTRSALLSPGSLKKKEIELNVKELRGKRKKHYSVVGSPEYMALEILEESGYSETVDYWSLGVIFYELCFGITPFDAETVEETFMKIACWEDNVVVPEGVSDDIISPEAWELINGLLCEPEDRKGKNDVQEIKNLACFQNLNWSLLDERKCTPPFIPELQNDVDTSYFETPLTPEDFNTLDLDPESLKDILDAKLQSPQLIQDLVKVKINETPTNTTTTSPSYFKNTSMQAAFAGITFKHEDLELVVHAIEHEAELEEATKQSKLKGTKK
eukprot:TRINITY_DN5957_c0_g2_i1.p1 TRINITY_DN5957_c0_g2~~TRINITY_DN5957_c0_g2_i1.p1  ORF type:complete len:450 (+),score=123.28 TRINITY_DN5957_c0_g2_i1:482-1831(+)